MHLDEFDYELPSELIAQTPVTPRDHSRMLVFNHKDNNIRSCHFYNILDYLKKGDVVVINTTRVMNARLFGQKEIGTRIEILLHKKMDGRKYEVLLRPARKLKIGDKVKTNDITGEVISKHVDDGTAVMFFDKDPQKFGIMPLPSYIKGQPPDPNRYQTVYADKEGSAAAPTAGLHWTPELMNRARDKGVIFCEILLHVGVGTFRPVKTDDIRDHKMHSEYYEISAESAKILNTAMREKRRIIATGTTSVRTLEAVFAENGEIKACCGETDIFIYPPYKFKVVDALITNFHLPKSTLLMLVSAFVGRGRALDLYASAVKEKFRFFSFGDACFFC